MAGELVSLVRPSVSIVSHAIPVARVTIGVDGVSGAPGGGTAEAAEKFGAAARRAGHAAQSPPSIIGPGANLARDAIVTAEV